MRILGIESASLTASAAVIEDGRLLSECTTNFKKTHSETLLPMIDEVLTALNADLSSVDAIAVSEGPGSFTGLRIGAATAKGLAFSAGKPIIPVPTLDAIAYGAFGSAYILSPILDARRGEVYTGLYSFENGVFTVHEGANACPIEEQAEKAKKLSEKLGKDIMFLGDGLPVFRERLAELFGETGNIIFASANICDARASSVASLGELLFREGKQTDATEFLPVYLRKSQAEREREEKEARV